MSQTNVSPETQAMFQKAFKQNKKEREEKERKRAGNSSGNSAFIPTQWCALEDQVDVVGRVIGNPIEVRNNSTDPQVVYFSKMLNDQGTGYIEVRWKMTENRELDNNWILKELYDIIMKKEWVKYADGHKNEKGHDGEYQYINKGKTSFERLENNLKKGASPKFFPPRVYPRKKVLMNWLDRMDDWCKENKKFKLLSSKKDEWTDQKGEQALKFEYGVPEMVYTRIMDNVVYFRNSWDLDIVIKKNSDDLSNAYIIKDILEDKISPEAKKIGNALPLTEEEKAYEAFDIDALSAPTSYQKLLKNLVGLFTYADADTDGIYRFTERLKELAEKEAQEKSQEKASGEVEKESKEADTSKEVKVDTSTSEEVTSSRRQAVSENSLSIEDLCKANFPKWDNVPEDEKKEFLKNISKFEGKIPVYKNPDRALPCINKDCKFVDSDSRTIFPETVITCPVCGTIDNSGN